MKIIICRTDGEEIWVDDEDYPLLSRFPWYRGGRMKHPMTFLYGKEDTSQTVYMHQLIMGGIVGTDHRDGNVMNMQKDNLRAATKSQNGANSRKQVRKNGKPCSSKYKGVTFAQGKYRAVIRCEGKTYQLGSYINEEEAGRAYDKKAKELFGEYALINNC